MPRRWGAPGRALRRTKVRSGPPFDASRGVEGRSRFLLICSLLAGTSALWGDAVIYQDGE